MSNENDIDDGLTDEERAALAEDDGSGAGDPEATTEGQGADDDKAGEEAAAAAADEAKRAAEAAAAKANDDPAAKANDTATNAEQAAAETQPQQTPLLVAPSVEEAQSKLTEIEGKKETLLEQFDNGDLTAREYQKQLDALAKEERKLEFQIHEAELANKLEQQRLQNEWVTTCNSFIETNSIYKDNPRLYKMLDAEVRELANDPKTANWTGQKFLEEAHKALKQAFNLPDAKAPSKTITKKDVELPPNLSKVPAAEIEDTNGGRFAVLDRLANTDPIAYEETLAKMPSAERDAYLAAG